MLAYFVGCCLHPEGGATSRAPRTSRPPPPGGPAARGGSSSPPARRGRSSPRDGGVAGLHLVDDEGRRVPDHVVERAGAPVVLLGVPVEPGCTVLGGGRLDRLQQGSPDVAAPGGRADEEVLEVAL